MKANWLWRMTATGSAWSHLMKIHRAADENYILSGLKIEAINVADSVRGKEREAKATCFNH
jgi:hypothetical protein